MTLLRGAKRHRVTAYCPAGLCTGLALPTAARLYVNMWGEGTVSLASKGPHILVSHSVGHGNRQQAVQNEGKAGLQPSPGAQGQVN